MKKTIYILIIAMTALALTDYHLTLIMKSSRSFCGAMSGDRCRILIVFFQTIMTDSIDPIRSW